MVLCASRLKPEVGAPAVQEQGVARTRAAHGASLRHTTHVSYHSTQPRHRSSSRWRSSSQRLTRRPRARFRARRRCASTAGLFAQTASAAAGGASPLCGSRLSARAALLGAARTAGWRQAQETGAGERDGGRTVAMVEAADDAWAAALDQLDARQGRVRAHQSAASLPWAS